MAYDAFEMRCDNCGMEQEVAALFAANGQCPNCGHSGDRVEVRGPA